MPHGYPGTPVGDLFPLGQSVQGSGGGLSLKARTDPNEQRKPLTLWGPILRPTFMVSANTS